MTKTKSDNKPRASTTRRKQATSMSSNVSTVDLTERTNRLALQNAINDGVYQLNYVCRALSEYENWTDDEVAAAGGFGLVLIRRMLERVRDDLRKAAIVRDTDALRELVDVAEKRQVAR